MHTHFERTGPLTELTSYPQWAQDMVVACQAAKQEVLDHELWAKMRETTLDPVCAANFMIGTWPFIERFPAFMALNLLKTQYGRSAGDNLARRWLVRNIRVEQNHAEYWLNWAEGTGVTREEVLNGRAPHGTQTLAHWCEEVSANGTLAAGIAATNYAIEGVTGEWSQPIYESAIYADSIPAKLRPGTLRWLQLHAAYDDVHPWEALEIVCTLVGKTAKADEVAHLGECIRRSYTSMRIVGDLCMKTQRTQVVAEDGVAA
jgi:pyrroloquinoline quinone (PQQ) biosynthesis protein C